MADESVFQGDLLSGERVYWTGQPDPSAIFTASDLFMIPFSLLWGGFAFFWEASVLGLNPFFPTRPNSHPPLFMAVFGIPFVVVGLYIIFGRFFYKAWLKGRTTYAVTNQRLMIKTGGNLRALFLRNVPGVNKSVNSRGVGSLSFNDSPYGAYWGNSGMEMLGRRYGAGQFAFYDVPDAENVCRMVNELKAKASEPKG